MTEIVATGRTDGAEGSNLKSSLATYVDRFAISAEACAQQLVDGIERNADGDLELFAGARWHALHDGRLLSGRRRPATWLADPGGTVVGVHSRRVAGTYLMRSRGTLTGAVCTLSRLTLAAASFVVQDEQACCFGLACSLLARYW